MKQIYLKMTIIIGVYLLLYPSAIFAQANKIEVQGGSAVVPGTYPWIVSLKGNGKDICGGSLIAPQWVLTAGHCGQGLPGFMPKPDQVYVDLNVRSNPSSAAELIGVSQIFVYPGFTVMGGGVDLSLLKLTQASTKPTVSIAHANTIDTSYYHANSACKVLGWGETGSGKSDTLRDANIVIIDFITCQNNYQQGGQPIDDDVVCAGYIKPSPAAGAGSGDSGGPLIAADGNGGWKQIGVVSGGHSKITEETYPGLYTKVLKFSNWIDSVITANSSSGINDIKDLRNTISLFSSGADLRIKMNTSLPENCQLSIYDLSGKKVKSQAFQVIMGEQHLDISCLTDGLYCVQIVSEGNHVYKEKFIKNKE